MQALNAWLVGHDHGLLLQGPEPAAASRTAASGADKPRLLRRGLTALLRISLEHRNITQMSTVSRSSSVFAAARTGQRVRRPASRSPLRSTRQPAQRRRRHRITDLACGRQSRPGEGAGGGLSACHRARTPERPRSLRVDGCQRELSPRTARQDPLGAIGSPVCEKATVFVAQRYPIGFADRRAMSLLHRNRADGAVVATRYSGREIML